MSEDFWRFDNAFFMFQKDSTILFIGSHPDDIELGCGALIASLAHQCKILCITLSKNLVSSKNKNLIVEEMKSLQSLGIQSENIFIADFETRNFFKTRQEICDYLFQFNQRYRPAIVFTHAFADIHQDHEVVSKEALRIFKHQTVIGFEILPSSFKFHPNFFFEVSEKEVQAKLAALKCYKTYRDKNYMFMDATRSQFLRHGVTIGKKYAEAFDIIRLTL